MKNSLLFALILVIAIAGGTALFVYESRLPNNELVNRDVNSQLLKADALDSNINELALRSRASLDTNYDMLVRSTVALERTVSGLSDSYFDKKKIAGSLLETRFERFKTLMEVKLEQVENFKSSNSVLRNSEKYIPLVGVELTNQADQNELPEVANLYNQVVIDMLEFTKQGSTKPVEHVSGLGKLVLETEAAMPEESAIKILEYANHVSTAVDAKQRTDQYLAKVLNSGADDQMSEISNAWSLWQTNSSNSRENFRYYTIAYLLSILALVGVLVYRLRRLYTNLNKELENKAQEAKSTSEELLLSERQLAQSEKMASLGQLVGGITNEINTPLEYIASNMDTIKSRLTRLAPVFVKAQAISETLSDPNRDRSGINKLLKQQIIAYRNAGLNNSPENIDVLISDASEGLQEIKQIVGSLTNFSDAQDSPTQNLDINERVEATLEMSARTIGARNVSTKLQPDLPPIRGVSNQLNQVFTNLINNAVHATDANSGVITISSKLVGQSIQITVLDNGRGIEKDALAHVFEPFFTNKKAAEGNGLGLSIAQRIVKAHSGEVAIESIVENGTKVTVTLPVAEN